MKKKIIFIIILLCLSAAGIILFIFLRNYPQNSPKAEIYQNGVLIKTLDMNVEQEIRIDCGSGFNIIKTSGGKVRVSSADCPDKICVKQGEISGGVVPIVCLPHRLEIMVTDK